MLSLHFSFFCAHLFRLFLSHLPVSSFPSTGFVLPAYLEAKCKNCTAWKRKGGKTATQERHWNYSCLFLFFYKKIMISEMVPRLSVPSDVLRLFFFFFFTSEKQKLYPCKFPRCQHTINMQRRWKTSSQPGWFRPWIQIVTEPLRPQTCCLDSWTTMSLSGGSMLSVWDSFCQTQRKSVLPNHYFRFSNSS